MLKIDQNKELFAFIMARVMIWKTLDLKNTSTWELKTIVVLGDGVVRKKT